MIVFLVICTLTITTLIIKHLVKKNSKCILSVTYKYESKDMDKGDSNEKYYVEAYGSKIDRATFVVDKETWARIEVKDVLHARIHGNQLEDLTIYKKSTPY